MVHLHSVRLRGFKTFAKPTELTFEPGITVIIGPNGSGKSNIADAVLWVLGEQSPANLRGRSMQDVIFSGPGGQRSSAVAEVSLVFDNGCGSLPLDCEQLEVTRRLSRDTGSEYRLNGAGCRLMDVQDLVGGLGLGREMHSVISQGKVEALLNSTPEVRRAMVEEAAGLGRFKKRRERARAKLERTRQNLLRVGDVEREVRSALRPLRQQVVAAERFAEATESCALAKGRLLVHGLGGLLSASAERQRELKGIEDRRDDIERSLADLRGQRVAEEERFNAVIEEREKLAFGYHRARAVAEYLEGRAVALRQRLARVEGEADRARRRLELSRSETESLAARVQAVSVRAADEARLAQVGGWVETLRTLLEESLPAYRAAMDQEDELKDSVFELEAARSRAVQDREFLRREVEERARVGAELESLAADAATRLGRLREEGSRLQQELEAAVEAAVQAQAGLRGAAEAREEARAEAEEAALVEAKLAEELAGLAAREAVLHGVLSRQDGTSAGARELLTTVDGCRALAEALEVEPGFERAVAAALGAVVGSVVVPPGLDLSGVFGADGALEAIWESREEGSSERTTAPPEGTRDLWDVLSGPEGVIATLRRITPPTAVVTDSESFDSLVAIGIKGPWRVVSRGGELLQQGLHAARRQEIGAEALLVARNELVSVSQERETLLAAQVAARETAERAAAVVAEAEGRHREQEERLHRAERAVTAQRGEGDLHQRRVEEAELQCTELQDRRERDAGLTDQLLADLRSVEEGMTGREGELEEARTTLRGLQGRLEVMRDTVGRLEGKKGQAALLEVRLRERCRALESERARIRAQRETAEEEMVRCERRVEFLDRYVPVLTDLLAVGERVAERSRNMAASLESRMEETRAHTESATRALRDRGGAEADLQREHEELSARAADIRVDQARLEERRVSLDEELTELRRRHLSPRGLTPADVAGEDAVELAAAVERAERKRERIGPVNPLAEQECAEMEERAAFLAEQRRDLEASLTQLEDVIKELEDHIERTFGEIFEATREHFSAVIASVFPGAKGSLKLTEGKAPAHRPQDESLEVLEEGEEEREPVGGIAIEVKFPNKSPRSLSLLSGGEKAMTAIAFLFSLFLARPCPFYILDEVEASLDDINIRRFLALVRKYRDRTQFIIITHQRQTMEVADTLYGVTLESDGTSRVLSRRLATVKGA